jgi:hypothetical protein
MNTEPSQEATTQLVDPQTTEPVVSSVGAVTGVTDTTTDTSPTTGQLGSPKYTMTYYRSVRESTHTIPATGQLGSPQMQHLPQVS